MTASYSASQTSQPNNPTAPHTDTRLVDRSKLTQMFQHYVETKDKYPHAMLLYRVGDFFECYFEDAVTLAQELELSLTSKSVGEVGRVAMSGVPHHAWERHATQLVEKGYAVVICDQVEDAAEAAGRLVRREITRILTPGTLLEEGMLKSSRNNYLAAVVMAGEHWGLAYADISTGEFLTTQGSNLEHLTQELMRLQPAEVLIPTNAPDLGSLLRPGEKSEHLPQCLPPSFCYSLRSQIPFSQGESRARLLQKFKVRSLEGLGCDHLPLAVRAAGGLLEYLEDTQKENAIPLQSLRTYTLTDFLIVDHQTRRNLEITQTVRDGTFHGSLLWALDKTSTAMGSRALRRWLLQPLLDIKGIRTRQDTIQELVENTTLRQELRQLLRQIYDLDRLTGRAGSGTANARDLLALADSLSRLPELSRLVADARSPFLKALQKVPPVLEELAQQIRGHLVESPPIHIKEGGLIRPGVHVQLDERRATVEDDQKWIANLEVDERAKTGIPTLKVGFNKTFGYYISISRAKADQVPSNYIRKQTLVNEERYITPELKEREARILTARDDLNQLEYEIFVALREEVGSQAEVIRNISRAVAAADVLCGLAELAVHQGYCRPEMVEGREITIVDGRHPVVEQSLPAGFFVPNSTQLGREEEDKGNSSHPDLIILTGPNASGKSCYLRQVGLIQLIAQIGSFVPAREARLGVCDRIFTRVGAVDDLATGQSTFMVEMNETANILNHATSRSLVLLDEIGRGTATFDGLSIAWAVAEYIATEIRARTIFATHYHELNELASLLPNVANYQVTVKELPDQIIFLHQVQPGGADKSYGIEAGRLAGLPKVVIARAKQVMGQIEKHSKIAVGLQNLE
ncbi:DNA mismatch repair protein MutS [Scytonema sp. HK-05]|uniref:DNA mismatch repair protein MutS n=1 Tax=Scytonema sp. HK-05 TaxID=1137095 RepID=UPI000935C12D|nr:DNA mismatch repair protein MutS [Scytonema sp. HK-05]OKH55128.1 DNA mismatch repair protein MutS [Scytonema sp. HK-05]BAY43892.1 DNA mismatch repair protein MutS [Scytonema sp. HK-05]